MSQFMSLNVQRWNLCGTGLGARHKSFRLICNLTHHYNVTPVRGAEVYGLQEIYFDPQGQHRDEQITLALKRLLLVHMAASGHTWIGANLLVNPPAHNVHFQIATFSDTASREGIVQQRHEQSVIFALQAQNMFDSLSYYFPALAYRAMRNQGFSEAQQLLPFGHVTTLPDNGQPPGPARPLHPLADVFNIEQLNQVIPSDDLIEFLQEQATFGIFMTIANAICPNKLWRPQPGVSAQDYIAIFTPALEAQIVEVCGDDDFWDEHVGDDDFFVPVRQNLQNNHAQLIADLIRPAGLTTFLRKLLGYPLASLQASMFIILETQQKIAAYAQAMNNQFSVDLRIHSHRGAPNRTNTFRDYDQDNTATVYGQTKQFVYRDNLRGYPTFNFNGSRNFTLGFFHQVGPTRVNRFVATFSKKFVYGFARRIVVFHDTLQAPRVVYRNADTPQGGPMMLCGDFNQTPPDLHVLATQAETNRRRTLEPHQEPVLMAIAHGNQLTSPAHIYDFAIFGDTGVLQPDPAPTCEAAANYPLDWGDNAIDQFDLTIMIPSGERQNIRNGSDHLPVFISVEPPR